MSAARDRPLVFLVAAEPSGDQLGAKLIGALNEIAPGALDFAGVGGPRMAARGVESPFDIRELSVLGLLEGLAAYPRVVARADETAEYAEALAPDIAVLIDSWGFTLRVAQRLRRRLPDLKIIKYAGPQVWATRPGRARTLAETVDEVLVLQPFEPPYFERAGLKATFVGHPVLDELPTGDGVGFRARYGLGGGKKIAAILFGSRSSEVRRLAGVLAAAGARVKARFGNKVALVAPLAEAVATQVRARAADDPNFADIMFVDEPEKADAFAAADVAIACSGTVVQELAFQGVPTVAAYKLGWVTWALARLLYTAPHVSLVNMAAGERLAPEFIQLAATPANLADAAAAFLEDEALAAHTRKGLGAAIAAMRGEGGASSRAAEAVLRALKTA